MKMICKVKEVMLTDEGRTLTVNVQEWTGSPYIKGRVSSIDMAATKTAQETYRVGRVITLEVKPK